MSYFEAKMYQIRFPLGLGPRLADSQLSISATHVQLIHLM